MSEQGFRFVLEYDGRDFEGWQAQAGERAARTVQATLEGALAEIVGHPVRVRGAGRTDAGVHALGQVASATVRTSLEPGRLRRALNALLPRDVGVVDAARVPADWDALREARGKHYRYRIWNGPERSPLRADRWHRVAEPLDPVAMRAAAGRLVGRHDFAAFQGAGSSARTTVRTLEALEVEGEGGAEIRIEARGEGFLRHMVRNLAGTLIEVGRGRWEPEEVDAILASGDRGRAGPTAPAHGLLLVAVRDSWSEGAAAAPGPGGSVDDGDPVG